MRHGLASSRSLRPRTTMVISMFCALAAAAWVGAIYVLWDDAGEHSAEVGAAAPSEQQPVPEVEGPLSTSMTRATESGRVLATTHDLPVTGGLHPVAREGDESIDSMARALASAFAQEVRDETWAGQMERDLASATVDTPGLEIRSLDCKSTMCSLTVSHGNSVRQQRDTFLAHVQNHQAFAGEVFAYFGGELEEAGETQIWVGRSGHSLDRMQRYGAMSGAF